MYSFFITALVSFSKTLFCTVLSNFVRYYKSETNEKEQILSVVKSVTGFCLAVLFCARLMQNSEP